MYYGKVFDSCEKYDFIKDKWVEVEFIFCFWVDYVVCVNGGNLYVFGGISNFKY